MFVYRISPYIDLHGTRMGGGMCYQRIGSVKAPPHKER